MKTLRKIVYDKYEPTDTEVLWIKPVEGGITFYLFDGNWKAQQLVNDKGTAATNDDTVIDVKSLPSLEDVEQKIQAEVTAHDAAVQDVHQTDSGDSDDYPDVGNLFH